MSVLVVVIWKLVRKLLFTLLLPMQTCRQRAEERCKEEPWFFFPFLLFFSRLDGQVESARGGDVRSCKIRVME